MRSALLQLCLLLAAWPALAADPGAGRALAAQRCQACHGVDGLSRQPNAPNIAGDPEFYLAKQLAAFKSGRRQDEQMQIVAQELSDRQIEDLVAWYASIQVEAILP